MGRIATKRHDLLVFLAALAISGLFWIFVPGESALSDSIFHDYETYYAPVARNLAAGKGLVTDRGELATLYPPVYPLMLAALIHLSSWTGVPFESWVVFFTLTCAALSTVLLFNIGWRTLGLRCGFITAALWATYPAPLWLSKQPASDIVFLPFFYAALLLLLPLLLDETDSPLAAAGVGAMMGIAVLIRPMALLAAPVLAFCLAYYGSRESWWMRLRPATALLAGCAAALLPWEVFVWQQTGGWIPVSTNGPASIARGLLPDVTPVALQGTQGAYGGNVRIPTGVRLILDGARDRDSKQRLHTREDVIEFLAETARERPLQLMQLIWWKAKRAWYAVGSRHEQETWIAWTHGAYLLSMACGAMLLAGGPEIGRRWLAVSGLLVLCYWAMTVVAHSIARHMIPVMGLMFVWQAALLERGWEYLRRRRETPRRATGR